MNLDKQKYGVLWAQLWCEHTGTSRGGCPRCVARDQLDLLVQEKTMMVVAKIAINNLDPNKVMREGAASVLAERDVDYVEKLHGELRRA